MNWKLLVLCVGVSACDGRFAFDVPSEEPVALPSVPDLVSEQDASILPEPALDGGYFPGPTPRTPETQSAVPTVVLTAMPTVVPTVVPTVAPVDAGSSEPIPDPTMMPDASLPPMSGACRDDSDCGLSTLHCDYQTGLCFECVQDEDCAPLGAGRCDVALHRCVECGVGQDCPDGFSCDPTSRSCLPECEYDEDCPDSAHECEYLRGLCIQCDQDWECEDDGLPYCGLGGASCVECREDFHCGAPLLCDALLGRCVECRHAIDCESGASCDPSSRECVRPSVMDARSL